MYCMTYSTSNPAPIIINILISAGNSNFISVVLNILVMLIQVLRKDEQNEPYIF